MNRLNDKIADNREKKNKLENENYNIESEFIEKLKDMEKESVYLEVEMDRIKDEKAQLLSEIVEAEKQILLWERKINLEREMQETLDPNYGQKEIQELKKEIHRMELRLDDIRKKQENVILEMERAVYKRETIQLKYIDKDKQGQKNTPVQTKS
jgi:coiled-coil domain-containing protein 40